MYSRTRLTLTALCCALIWTPLAACNGVLGTTAPAAVQLAPAQALYVSELTYNAFAQAALAALNNPATPADVKVKIRDVDKRAYAALAAARQGTGAANAVLTIVASAQPYLGVK